MKKRVWTKEEIESAFVEYLRTVNLVESNKWSDLSVGELEALYQWHFRNFEQELKRWTPKRKIEIE